MDKLSKILFGIWMLLAVISFVASFWAPIFFKILGLVFGGMNILIILSWVIAYFQTIAAKKNVPTEEDIKKVVEDLSKVMEEDKPKKTRKAKKEE